MNSVSPTNTASPILYDRSAGVWPGVCRDLDDELADAERLAVREQAVKIAAVGPQVFGVEHRPEDSLHVLDVLTDADPRTGLGFDVRRA